MATSTRGARSNSLDLVGAAARLGRKAQTAGPTTLLRVMLVCGFAVSWKATGALLVPLAFLLSWRVISDAVWAYGLPRWLPVLGKRYRGRRAQLAARGYPMPSFPSYVRMRRAEKKRFRKACTQWAVASDVNSKLLGQGGEVVPLERMRTTLENDVIAHVRSGVRGVPPREFLNHSEQIKATVGCKEFVVRYVGVDEAELTFLWTERLERELLVASVPRAPKGYLAFGIRRDGGCASIPLCLPILVSGMSGSGKSSFVWSLFNDLNRQQLRTDLWCCDNKGGAELRALADKARGPAEAGEPIGPNGHLLVRGYAANVEEAAELIADFYDAMKERLRLQTYRKWTVAEAAKWPLLVLLIDETVELIKLSDRKVRDLLLTIVSQIRAAGGMVIALTQLSQKSVLDDLRDMFPIRLSLAQRNAINTNMALGDGAEAGGARCSELTIPADAGRGFSFDEGQKGYEPFRAGWCTDSDIEGWIAQGLAIGEPTAAATPDERCAVYRMYNELGELLYVGISNTPAERWKQHANPNNGNDYKPWFGSPQDQREVCWQGDHKPLVVWYHGADARAQAERAETLACEQELPRYNDRKNPEDNPLKVRWRDRRRTGVIEPELLQLDAELEAEGVGLDILDTIEQPALGDPEPVELPEVPTPTEVPEQTQPEPEVPEVEPREDGTEWAQPPSEPAETRDELAPRRTSSRRPRQPVAARRRA